MTTFDLSDPALLFSQEFIDDPAPFYEFLRAHAPVWEMPGSGTFVVSTAALVAEAVARPEEFSSNLTSLLYTDDAGLPTVFDMSHRGAAIHVLATADPPTHTAHRRLLQPVFSPAAVERIAPFVDAWSARLVEALVETGRGDVATGLAEPLPIQVIAAMVGIPADDVPELAPSVLRSNDLLAGVLGIADMVAGAEASNRVNGYLTELLRTWVPTADGATACDALTAAIDTGAITVDESLGMLVQLLGAGTETTTSLIGRASLQLARDRDRQDGLRADPSQLDRFIEEVLRVDGPFRFHYRSTPVDTELGGVSIPAGSRVLLLWAAANLDGDHFDRPDDFDPARAALRSHFAFGRGLHFCIGAPLARLEARSALAALLAGTRDFRLDPENAPSFRRSIFVRKLDHLPVLLD
ncbi:MAG: cytochrome P450 [Acidimicrobiia bacterium]|nr:cytochrome P450 [Acidimicrobiia bacterium]